MTRRLHATCSLSRIRYTIGELPPSIDPFCTGHVQDWPLTRISFRNGDSLQVTGEEFCFTLLDEINHQDTVIVRGVRVSSEAFHSSAEMQQWARDNEGRFVRESLTRPMWAYRPGEDLDRDSVLTSDSLGRQYRARLQRLAGAVDATTGLREWVKQDRKRLTRRWLR